jgi:hypothetical protein
MYMYMYIMTIGLMTKNSYNMLELELDDYLQVVEEEMRNP